MSEPSQMANLHRWRLQAWLHIHSSAKPGVYQQVFATAQINDLSYWLGIFFSAGIATFGLVENSPAVIIGAMLISPLMGPIMGTGLALAIGDLYLGFKAVLNLLASVAVSIGFSGLLVWLLPFHSATSEILARTNPNLLDLGIALLCGLAGSVVVCRGSGDGVTALPGVAIAVALMPPLCAMGFGLGSGVDLQIMGGAGLLFLTNLVAIVATAFIVFLLVGMGTPEVQRVMLAGRGDNPLAKVVSRGPLSTTLAAGGQLRWRILMVLILLGSIAVPLHRALLQVANETIARSAVQGELKRLAPSGEIVFQSVTLDPSDIVIRLISTRGIPDSTVTEVRQDLMRRTGRNVEISVEAVASKGELAEIMARLDKPAPVVPTKKSAADIQKELLDMVGPAIQAIWPSSDAPLQDFDVVLSSSSIEIDVRYQATQELGNVPIDMVLQNLRTKLGIPDLALKAERVPAPQATTSHHAPVQRRKR
jgi:uncharacterized hydrophobic protein (TIGR00271 family)